MPISSDIELTPEQAESVNYKGNSLLVRGVAGSGKSHVLMFRALHLYKEAIQNNQSSKILILTYTKALVKYTEQMLELQGINPHAITVFNIDKLIWDCCLKMGHPYINIAEDSDRYEYVIDALNKHMNMSSDKKHRFYSFNPQFWVDEFDWIMQRTIKSQEEYINAERSGRGSKKRLSRDDRVIAYEIFEIYSNILKNNRKHTYENLYEYAYSHRSSIPSKYKYDYVLIDEAQDLYYAQLRFATCITGKAITVAADMGQKIYKKSFAWKDIGIDIRGRASKKLSVPFRNTVEIWHLTESLQNVNRLSRDNISDMTDSTPPDISGVMPIVFKCPNSAAENDLVCKLSEEMSKKEGTTGILCRTYEVLRVVETILSGKIKYEVIGKKADWNIVKQGIKVCTMHSSKGLEFDNVIIPCFDQAVMPVLKDIDVEDEEELKEALVTERTVLYVAMSRARNTLVFTHCGAPSRFLGEFDPNWYNYTALDGSIIEKPEFCGVTDEQVEFERTRSTEKGETKSGKFDIAEGSTVYHNIFGVGTVSGFDILKNLIRVKFDIGEKSFVFPDAFKKGFLRTEK